MEGSTRTYPIIACWLRRPRAIAFTAACEWDPGIAGSSTDDNESDNTVGDREVDGTYYTTRPAIPTQIPANLDPNSLLFFSPAPLCILA